MSIDVASTACIDLYRFYDALDRLLYIGISLNAAQRASQHRQDKQWWGDVVRMEVEHLAVTSRREAEQLEREAIERESPLHNVVWNAPRAVARNVNEPRLVWTCRICEQDVADGEGYIELPDHEHRRYAAETAAWEAEYGDDPHEDVFGFKLLNLTAVLAMPKEPSWQVLHRRCDPEPDDGGYWFDVARARTYPQILGWTTHLMEKEWLARTNWGDFLRRVRAA